MIVGRNYCQDAWVKDVAGEMSIQIGAIADHFKNNPSTVPMMGRVAAAQSLNTAMMALLTAVTTRQGGGVFGDKRDATMCLFDSVVNEVKRVLPPAWDAVLDYLISVRGQANCGDLIAQTAFMEIEGVTKQMLTHERLHLAIHILTALGRQVFMVQEGPQTFQHPYLPPLVQTTFEAMLRECSVYRCGHDDVTADSYPGILKRAWSMHGSGVPCWSTLLQQILLEAQSCHEHCLTYDGKVYGQPPRQFSRTSHGTVDRLYISVMYVFCVRNL
jgi:hypothetical protein